MKKECECCGVNTVMDATTPLCPVCFNEWEACLRAMGETELDFDEYLEGNL